MVSDLLGDMRQGCEPARTHRCRPELAHQEQNAVRAAYNRAEYLGERRTMMNHWADYLDVLATGNIVPFKAQDVSQ